MSVKNVHTFQGGRKPLRGRSIENKTIGGELIIRSHSFLFPSSHAGVLGYISLPRKSNEETKRTNRLLSVTELTGSR